MGDVTSDQYFMEDQRNCKNNDTNDQYFKHDSGQEHPQDSQTNSRAILSGFDFSSQFCIPTLVLTIQHCTISSTLATQISKSH